MVHSKNITGKTLERILLDDYNLKLNSFKNIRAAIKVNTNHGNFGFVKADSRRKNRGLAAFIKHLSDNNFHQIANILPTLGGEYSVNYDDKKVKLIQWIDGKECDLDNPNILAATAETYARFHKASMGFTPPPKTKWSSNIGKWPENFQKRYEFILQVKKDCLSKTKNTKFEEAFLASVNYFLKDMKLAINLLINSNYRQLAVKELASPHTIHHSCYYQNLIYSNSKQVYIIDYGKLMMDFPIHDISNLMIRHVRHNNWNFSSAKIILNNYQIERELSKSELKLLKILILFPERYIKIIEKYQQENKDEEYLLKHLSHLTKEIDTRHEFIGKFEHTYI